MSSIMAEEDRRRVRSIRFTMREGVVVDAAAAVLIAAVTVVGR